MNREVNLTFKILFKVNCHNKLFQIFVDQSGRKTFLEIDSDGKYKYPLFEDFVYLNKIYNQRNPFISYEGYRLPVHDAPRFSFKEFVRCYIGNLALLISVVSAASIYTGITMGRVIELDVKNHKVDLVVNFVDGSIINHTSELDEILGYKSVSVDEIIDAINANDKIDEYYKNFAINFVKFMKNKYPLTDQRIFYENVKNMLVCVSNDKEMGEYIAGTYNSVDNVTTIRDDHVNSEQVITHEFAHSYHHWKEDSISFPKYRTDLVGYALDEAMTNKIISGLVNTTTYVREGKVLDYFLSCVEYDYYDYETEGIAKLITLLKEKYSNVDIDYLIDAIDTMKDTEANLGGNIKLEENIHILDQFFMICCSNINESNSDIYKPFADFLELFDLQEYKDLANEYLTRYNNLLIENGYDSDLINTHIEDFINMIMQHNALKKNFKLYLFNHDQLVLDENNLYKTFYDYLSYGGVPFRRCVSDKKMYEFFYDMLDIYNDYLYRNGYNNTQVITREEAENKISKFKNINVIGFDVSLDDVLYPVIDIPDSDKVYNIDTKVPSLDENGNIILLDKEDMRVSKRTSDGIYQYYFTLSLFANIDNDSLVFDESYWQNQFHVYHSEYKKIDLLLNGNKIGEDYLYGIKLVVGQREDGSNVFSLYSDRGQILDGGAMVKSQTIDLVKFMRDDPYKDQAMTSLELNEYLNYEYLREEVAGENLKYTSTIYYDIFTYDIENDVINVHPPYFITISDSDVRTNLNRIILDIGPGYADIWMNGIIDSAKSYVSTDVECEETLYLETVLAYYGILDENITEYTFSKNEILELYGRYVQDVYINKSDLSK